MHLHLLRRFDHDHPRLELYRQHQPVIDALECLMQSFDGTNPHEALAAALDSLAASARAHFQSQEEAWDDEPDRQQVDHREAHRLILADVLRVRRAVAERPDRGSLLSGLRFIEYWLMIHFEDEHLARI